MALDGREEPWWVNASSLLLAVLISKSEKV